MGNDICTGADAPAKWSKRNTLHLIPLKYVFTMGSKIAEISEIKLWAPPEKLTLRFNLLSCRGSNIFDALLCAERGVFLVFVGRGVQGLDGELVSELVLASPPLIICINFS